MVRVFHIGVKCARDYRQLTSASPSTEFHKSQDARKSLARRTQWVLSSLSTPVILIQEVVDKQIRSKQAGGPGPPYP